MEKRIKNEFYNKLDWDKIKINWNKNPITMELFLSFLTVDVERSRDHLGSSNGWTKLINKELNLEISGGRVNGVEYLDSLQYGVKLHNPYNNFVNVFYLFDILNNEGKLFFIDYYKSEIKKVQQNISNKIINLKSELQQTIELEQEIINEILRITP